MSCDGHDSACHFDAVREHLVEPSTSQVRIFLRPKKTMKEVTSSNAGLGKDVKDTTKYPMQSFCPAKKPKLTTMQDVQVQGTHCSFAVAERFQRKDHREAPTQTPKTKPSVKR